MTVRKNNIQQAIADLKNGKMIILTDDKNRENEGDMVFPAALIHPAMMNFMIRHGTGIVCLSLSKKKLQSLNLSLLCPGDTNTSRRQTPFTMPIDALQGITTGVSAQDRVTTVQTALKKNAKPEDLARPGHVYPLEAKEGGVLERPGHTEGARDLVTLAGFEEGAVLCEVMNPDGTMAKDKALAQFAQKYKLTGLTIQDIIDYRLQHEDLIHQMASAHIYIQKNTLFKTYAITEKYNFKNHIVLWKDPVDLHKPLRVRIHSSCLTGDVFGSLQCDCQSQLHYALEKISLSGGILIYLDQEGRGVGLINKIKAYHIQQTRLLDTVSANQHLGLSIDERNYAIGAHIIKKLLHIHQFGFPTIKLLTNNPHKIQQLKKYGLKDVIREPIPVFCQQYNHAYLLAKKNKLGHLIKL